MSLIILGALSVTVGLVVVLAMLETQPLSREACAREMLLATASLNDRPLAPDDLDESVVRLLAELDQNSEVSAEVERICAAINAERQSMRTSVRIAVYLREKLGLPSWAARVGGTLAFVLFAALIVDIVRAPRKETDVE